MRVRSQAASGARRRGRRAARRAGGPVAAVENIEGPLERGDPPHVHHVGLADDLDVFARRHARRPGRPHCRAGARSASLLDEPSGRSSHAPAGGQADEPFGPAIADELVSRIDIHTLEDRPAPERLEPNDIAVSTPALRAPRVDPYRENRATGAFVLIDEATNETVAAGMIDSATG